jgi:hypothetical protein
MRRAGLHQEFCDASAFAFIDNKEKGASARGSWLRRTGGFTDRTAPANKLLERRYTASDNNIFETCWNLDIRSRFRDGNFAVIDVAFVTAVGDLRRDVS